MTLCPAPPNTGIVFIRTDRPSRENRQIHATNANVHSTQLCTTIGNNEGLTVSTIEHLMAAFVGAGIDNAFAEVDAPEVPIMDGSAAPFVFLIREAGVVEQGEARRSLQLLRRVEVGDSQRYAVLRPATHLSISFAIAFDDPAIGNQRCVFSDAMGSFESEIAPARTFGFADEVNDLRSRGLALGGSLDNAVVVGDGKILNEGGLRYKDEFVRHKVLDVMGDLYLLGVPLLAHFEGVCTGHNLHHFLVSAVLSDRMAWRLTGTDLIKNGECDEDEPLLEAAGASA